MVSLNSQREQHWYTGEGPEAANVSKSVALVARQESLMQDESVPAADPTKRQDLQTGAHV